MPGSTDVAQSEKTSAISDKESGEMLKEMKGANSSEEAVAESLDKDDVAAAAAEHKSLFIESQYPSATTCATCHPKHFEEWSKSDRKSVV